MIRAEREAIPRSAAGPVEQMVYKQQHTQRGRSVGERVNGSRECANSGIVNEAILIPA